MSPSKRMSQYMKDQLEADVQNLVDQLSKEEAEIAARSSYHYYKQSTGDDEHFLARTVQAENMARRTLIAAKGDYDLSLRCVKETIQWRKDMKVDDIRECFYKCDDESSPEGESSQVLELQQLAKGIQQELITSTRGQQQSQQPRMVVRGCDKEGHAILHYDCSHLFEVTDKKRWLQSVIYMLERVLAVSSAHNQEQVIFCVNLRGASLKTLPPTSLLKELVHLLSQHYCERLYRVYLVDAPLKYRSVWCMIRPFVDAKTKQKFIWLAGNKQKLAEVGSTMDPSQAMTYMLPTGKLTSTTNVDMGGFLYDTPFDEAYREVDVAVVQ